MRSGIAWLSSIANRRESKSPASVQTQYCTNGACMHLPMEQWAHQNVKSGGTVGNHWRTSTILASPQGWWPFGQKRYDGMWTSKQVVQNCHATELPVVLRGLNIASASFDDGNTMPCHSGSLISGHQALAKACILAKYLLVRTNFVQKHFSLEKLLYKRHWQRLGPQNWAQAIWPARKHITWTFPSHAAQHESYLHMLLLAGMGPRRHPLSCPLVHLG
jgi:hypothetical protein